MSKKPKINGFFETKYCFFQKPWQLFSFFMLTTHVRTKKSQVVEYNIIQMLTQNQVKVGSVCGPGEKKKFFMFFSETLTLKNAFSYSKQLLFYDFLGISVFLVQKGKKVIFSKDFLSSQNLSLQEILFSSL
jgi:hypothetical protein